MESDTYFPLRILYEDGKEEVVFSYAEIEQGKSFIVLETRVYINEDTYE